MSRKQQTTVTFSVKITLPKDTTVADWINIIQRGVAGYSGQHILDLADVKVSLIKRETTYGPG